MVWAAQDGGIYVWAPGDGAPTNVNTTPGVDGTRALISGNRVVWEGEADLSGDHETTPSS